MKKSISILFASSLVASLLACSPGITTEAPQFTLQPAQTSLEVTPGGEVSSFVLLDRKAGFTDTVRMRLDAADLPAGLTQEWSRDSVNGDCTLRLLASENTPPGTYKIDLTGTPVQEAPFTGTPIEGSSLRQTGLRAADLPIVQGNFTVTVGPNLADFSVSAQPAIVSSPRALNVVGLAEVALRINAQNGFVGPVDLSVNGANGSGLPQGVTASFSRSTVTPSALFDHSVLRLFVAGNAVPGTYILNVIANNALKSKTIPVLLTVEQIPFLFNFTRLIPDSISTTRPSSPTTPANTGIQLIAEQNGGSGSIISFENLPAGVNVTALNGPFRPLPFPQPSKLGWRFFRLNVGPTAPLGTFPITVKMILDGNVQVRILSLEIKASQ
jgi:hypothetical protein